jgi:hypothetical protein
VRGRRAYLTVEHPVDLLAGTGRTLQVYSSPAFEEHYRELVQKVAEPAVCVIEHAAFTQLLDTNLEYNIPTIACIANIESFDRTSPLSSHSRRKGYLAALDFADEFRALALCDERLFLSKVEAGLIGGLGLSANYYPYLPVGAIRRGLEKVRMVRSKEGVGSGLFLMLGSGQHSTTWESLSWFVQNARRHGLPSGVRVVVGGLLTDTLLGSGPPPPGLELRGWLDQDELDRLLSCVQAVLIPQSMGFGALTRLPEFACAGIPVAVSRHPTYAIDPPPGLTVVDDHWDAWYGTVQQMANQTIHVEEREYSAWEEKQANSLRPVVSKLLSRKSGARTAEQGPTALGPAP